MARVIRYLFEHGHPWPLWESGTDKYAMEPTDYGLSEDLTERLSRCYRLWERHRDLEGAWDPTGSRDEWWDQSSQALAILRREAAHLADVTDERG